MKICKRIAAIALCLLTLAALVPLQAAAAGPVDMSRSVSLTIENSFTPDDASEKVCLADVPFEVYLVSKMDATGELTVTSEFSDYAEDLDIRGQNEDAWKDMAETLEEFVLKTEPQYTAIIQTDSNGIAKFNNLEKGLYLVLGTWTVQGDYLYETLPFLVTLPSRDPQTDEWIYDVQAKAKPKIIAQVQDLTVKKVWKDSCHQSQRPKSITVDLLCDGEVVDTVTLPQDGQWSYTWEGLNMNLKWTVSEARVDGYAEPEIERQGNTFIITNVCKRPTSKLPQTGQLWWPVPLLCTAGLVLLVLGLALRRRGSANEE